LITERRVPELILVFGSQPAGGVSHKPGGRLPLLFARPAVTPATLNRAATNFAAESSTLTTRLPSHDGYHVNTSIDINEVAHTIHVSN